MAINYQRPLPHDSGSGEALQDFPAARLAHRRVLSTNAAISSVITLNDKTTMMEVTAGTVPAAIRWVASTDTEASIIALPGATANFDHIIPAGVLRRFVVPQERQGITSIAGANVANGCYARLAYISIGVGSVVSSEF
mgnify:CR=1 FL=1